MALERDRVIHVRPSVRPPAYNAKRFRVHKHLFTCLFNDAASISPYVVSNDAFSVHNFKGCGSKLFWPILTDFPDIFLEELRKSTKNALEEPVSASIFDLNAMLKMVVSVHNCLIRLTALVLDHHTRIL